MPRFKVGDYVERFGPLAPEYTTVGRIVRVIPHADLPAYLTEYDVDFGFTILTFYESQLRLRESPAVNRRGR
jgi:hypothetical protein